MKLVNFAASRGVSLYARGGGSSVTGASVPTEGVVVDTASLSQIMDLDESNRTVTVQAGVKLATLESKLNEKSFTLSQFPQSFELATVGGIISTLGTGLYSTLYGGIEDSVLRLEVVLPTGGHLDEEERVYAKDEVPLALLKRVKQAVDPGETMSPGRLP